MKTIEQELPTPVRALVDEHLDSLERVLLSAGVSRRQRQAICEDVELQFREMLWQRSKAAPTVETARAVLAELDPPEAYVEGVEATASQATMQRDDVRPRTHILALIAAIMPILGVMLLFTPLSRGGEGSAIVLLTCAELVALLLAVVAIREIRRFPERWTGTGLALFGVLALPLLVANFFVYMLLAPKYYHSIGGKAVMAHNAHLEMKRRITGLESQLHFMRLEPGMKEPVEVENEDELPQNTRNQIREIRGTIEILRKAVKYNKPTPFQEVLFEHRKAVEGMTYTLTVLIYGGASALLYIAVLRRVQPRPAT